MVEPKIFIERSAIFSGDRKYRYKLSRYWDDEGSPLVFVMLNPSTANENSDDPTIRRCIGFARQWGYAGIEVLNLYALVSSNPDKLLTEVDSIGIDNDWYLRNISDNKIVVAWGNFGIRFKKRVAAVLDILKNRDTCCLGETEQGQPKHPLYVPRYQTLEIYREKLEDKK